MLAAVKVQLGLQLAKALSLVNDVCGIIPDGLYNYCRLVPYSTGASFADYQFKCQDRPLVRVSAQVCCPSLTEVC